jgi:hypothetical protein
MNHTSPVNQTDPTPAPQPQVWNQFELLAQEIRDNDTIIKGIAGKLESVTPARPPVGGEKAAPEEYLVRLASELRDLSRQVRAQNDELRFILNAIEL